MNAKVFVLSSGRSGTLWLKELLSSIDKTNSFHEPGGVHDRRAFTESYRDEKKARQYIFNKRPWRPEDHNDDSVYYEVNSYLRYHASALQEKSNSYLVHLVRNPKSVIHSHRPRPIYTVDDNIKITPKKDDPFYDVWDQFNRFEKICWNWWNANKYLKDNIPRTTRLEDLNRSYKAFEKSLLKPFLNGNYKDKWQKYRNNKMHETSENNFPPPEDWSHRQKKSFEQICGPLAEELGYV